MAHVAGGTAICRAHASCPRRRVPDGLGLPATPRTREFARCHARAVGRARRTGTPRHESRTGTLRSLPCSLLFRGRLARQVVLYATITYLRRFKEEMMQVLRAVAGLAGSMTVLGNKIFKPVNAPDCKGIYKHISTLLHRYVPDVDVFYIRRNKTRSIRTLVGADSDTIPGYALDPFPIVEHGDNVFVHHPSFPGRMCRAF